MSDFDEVRDFVVVGSGGGSMCAGLVLRASGKDVLILEKTDLIGGTTARSGGVMWIPNNPFMRRDGVDDSFEKACAYLDAVVGDHDDQPGATKERRHTYLREGPNMVNFLVAQGVQLDRVGYWPDYYDEFPGGSEAGRTVVAKVFDTNELGEWIHKLRPSFAPLAGPLEELMKIGYFRQSWLSRYIMLKTGIVNVVARLFGKRLVTAGAALQGRMLLAATRAGVDFRVASPVSELIMEGGAVTGLVTLRDGKPWRIGARLGVLVNAGGFAHNQRMRDRYQPGTSVKWTNTAPGDTGEMIETMMRSGAAVAQMDTFVGYQLTLPPGSEARDVKPSMQRTTAGPHCILVDQSGVRYMNEGGSYMAYCLRMLERNKTVPAVPSWAVFDSQHIAKYMFANTMPGSKKPAAWLEGGYLKKADTLADLARQMQVDAAALQATVERFNTFVANNRDEDFHRGERAYDRWLGDFTHKPSETLGKIESGPFYAAEVYPGDVGTYGGVVTDANARVLREDGSVIAGLYATGVSTASVMGRKYPGAGSSVGPSFVWGYVAANHAVSSGKPA
ncbi:MAG TPA: FAD-binding protein [Halioglobus sp.]